MTSAGLFVFVKLSALFPGAPVNRAVPKDVTLIALLSCLMTAMEALNRAESVC